MEDRKTEILRLHAQLAELIRTHREESASIGLSTETEWDPDGSSPLEVLSVADLYLADALTPLAKGIFDALPIHVFVKHSTIVEGRGRKYTFMNRAARKTIGWTAPSEVFHKFDSDALAGGYCSDQYQKMQKQETETLAQCHPRSTNVEWRSSERFGEDTWRNAKTLEIPIVGGQGETLGFCAIAQDIEFKTASKVHSFNKITSLHQNRNMVTGLESHFENVSGLLSQWPPSESLETAVASLRFIRKQLYLNIRVIKQLHSSFTDISTEKVGTLGAIIATLTEIYKDAYPGLKIISASPPLANRVLKGPDTIVSIIIELINNGIKHSETTSDKAVVIVGVADDEKGRVVWSVSNKSARVKRRMTIPARETIEWSDADNGMGSAIIAELLGRTYPLADFHPDKHFLFPSSPDAAGWVKVQLICDRGVALQNV